MSRCQVPLDACCTVTPLPLMVGLVRPVCSGRISWRRLFRLIIIVVRSDASPMENDVERLTVA